MPQTPGANFYINNFESSGEQTLIEDLVIESIAFYGIDLWYLTKTYNDTDQVYTENPLATFEHADMIVMYIKNVNGFEGEGDFMSKFGIEIRDSMVMSVARRTFDDSVGDARSLSRPREGDLIYFPLNGKIYEIMFVEHEPVFYQMGSLQFYDLSLELFEPSSEVFSTGIEAIDAKGNSTTLDLYNDAEITLEDGEPLNAERTGIRIIAEDIALVDIDDVADSENDLFQSEADVFLDFSDADPFSEGGRF